MFFIPKIFSTSSCPPILDDLLHPPGHGVTQGAQVLHANLHGPHLSDGLLQLRHWGDVLVVQLVFHVGPGIFYRIEVKWIAWPVHDLKRLVYQIGYCLIHFEEWQGTPSRRKWVLLWIAMKGRRWSSRTCWVIFTIHGDILRKERKGPHVTQLQKNRPRPSPYQGVWWFSPCTGNQSGWSLLASAPCSSLTSGNGKCFRQITLLCSNLLQSSYGIFLAKASLFFFIFSVRRGFCWQSWRASSASSESTSWCVTQKCRSSGTCCLMSPAVAQGFFLTNHSRTLRAWPGIFFGIPEPFFLSGICRWARYFVLFRRQKMADQCRSILQKITKPNCNDSCQSHLRYFSFREANQLCGPSL